MKTDLIADKITRETTFYIIRLSVKFSIERSGIVEISPRVRESGIRNPTFFCLWNPESWALESGIQSLESGIQSLESGIQPMESGIQPQTLTMESRSGMYYTVSRNYITNHHLPPPLGIPI